MPPGVEWVTDESGFAELQSAWEQLADGEPTPFLRHGWLTAWWRAFGAGRQLRVCTVWDGGELRAALPLCASGRRLEVMANEHSPTFGPLGSDAEALQAAAGAALRRGGQVALRRIAMDDARIADLTGGPRGRLSVLEPQYVSPAVELSGDFTSFRAATKSRWGAPLERFRRKMGRENAAETKLVGPPEDLQQELAAGFEVEASGWKGTAGTAILSTPETTRFYTDIATAFAARDELRLSTLHMDGRVAAFDLCLLFDGRLHLLKTGFDEGHRRLAPGLVLRLDVIERCYELGLRSHELGGSADAWKLKFANASRQHATLRLFARRPAPLVRFGYRRAVRPGLRAAYRRVRPR